MPNPYIFRQMHRIPGYLDPGDALILEALMRAQAEAGYRGGAAEIGVYYGRSWFLIRKLLGAGERALALDLFDAEEGRQLGAFRRNGASLGVEVDPSAVIAGDSGRLRAEDILARAGGPVRLFSVDGGHMLGHVAHDAELALGCLSREGVIVFDDFFNPEWPEVSVAVIDFIRAHWGELRPVAVSQKKLYVARIAHAAAYSAALETAPNLRRMGREAVGFLGHPALRIQHPLWRRMGYELLTRAGLGRMSALLY